MRRLGAPLPRQHVYLLLLADVHVCSDARMPRHAPLQEAPLLFLPCLPTRQDTYPTGWTWRNANDSRAFIDAGTDPDMWPNARVRGAIKHGHRIIVLLRDPVDAKRDTMRRFALCGNGYDDTRRAQYQSDCRENNYTKPLDSSTLDGEAYAATTALDKLENALKYKINCDRTIFIAYELLLANPEARKRVHVTRLAPSPYLACPPLHFRRSISSTSPNHGAHRHTATRLRPFGTSRPTTRASAASCRNSHL